MCRHPFLSEFCEVDEKGFHRLCHQGLREARVSTEHTVFIKREEASGGPVWYRKLGFGWFSHDILGQKGEKWAEIERNR